VAGQPKHRRENVETWTAGRQAADWTENRKTQRGPFVGASADAIGHMSQGAVFLSIGRRILRVGHPDIRKNRKKTKVVVGKTR